MLSLAAQVHFATVNTDRAYYGTDTRLYQLLAGALLTACLALTTRRLHPRPAHVMAVLGFAGVLLVGSGLWHVNPSWRGIAATGTAVLLLTGLAQAEKSPLSQVLAFRPMAYLGRISYGTYLWHWPMILALQSVLDIGPVTTAVLTFGLATGLAALSYELLEIPIRKWPRLDGISWPVVTTGLAVSALVAVFVVPTVLERTQRPALVSAAISGGSLTTDDQALTRELQASVPPLDFTRLSKESGSQRYCSAGDAAACQDVRSPGGPTVLLVGDSQAETFVPVFRRLAKEHHFNLDLNVLAGCPWQEDLTNAKQAENTAQECTKARVGWYDKVLPQLDPDVVVLLGRPRDDPAEWGSLVAGRDGKKVPLQEAVWTSTRDTLEKVTAVAPAVVVQRLIMPETFGAADCLAAAKQVGQCAVTAEPEPSATDGFATTLAAEHRRVHTLDLNPIFCPTSPVCSPIQHGQLVWRDDHHYTTDYAVAKRGEVWDALLKTGALGHR